MTNLSVARSRRVSQRSERRPLALVSPCRARKLAALLFHAPFCADQPPRSASAPRENFRKSAPERLILRSHLRLLMLRRLLYLFVALLVVWLVGMAWYVSNKGFTRKWRTYMVQEF